MSEPEMTSDVPDVPQETAEAKRRRWKFILLRTAIFLTLYVLSIGPMFWQWYEAEYMGGNPLVRIFYAPLRVLCYSKTFEDWLNWYINELWIA